MIGKPKYKEGTTVKFIIGNKLKTGVIWVVDKFGTFDYKEDVFKTKEELLKSL